MLYDRKKDPGEKKNVACKDGYQEAVAKLKNLLKQRQDEVEGDVNHIGKKVRGVEERLRNTEQAIAGLSEKIEAVDDKVDTANGKLDTIIGWHAQGHA